MIVLKCRTTSWSFSALKPANTAAQSAKTARFFLYSFLFQFFYESFGPAGEFARQIYFYADIQATTFTDFGGCGK